MGHSDDEEEKPRRRSKSGGKPRLFTPEQREMWNALNKDYHAKLAHLRELAKEAMEMANDNLKTMGNDLVADENPAVRPELTKAVVETYTLIHEATEAFKTNSKMLIYMYGGETKAAIKFLHRISGFKGVVESKVLEKLREVNPEALWALVHCTNPVVGDPYDDPPGMQLDIHISEIDGTALGSGEKEKWSIRSPEELLKLINAGWFKDAPLITICGNIPMLGKNVSLWCIPHDSESKLPMVNAALKRVFVMVDAKHPENGMAMVKGGFGKTVAKGSAGNFVVVIAKDEAEGEELRKVLEHVDAEFLVVPKTEITEITKWVGDFWKAQTKIMG